MVLLEVVKHVFHGRTYIVEKYVTRRGLSVLGFKQI